MTVKFISHMCPWLPQAFFEELLSAWGNELGEETALLVDLEASGPSKCQLRAGSHPLLNGQAEAGIVCAPTFLWAQQQQPPGLELAGWAPVFEEVDLPIYHSRVLVRASSPAHSLEDLRTAHWSFNDPCSLSGYYSVLTSLGCTAKTFEGRSTFSGGHMQSLEKLLAGEVEACAVDSNGWLLHGELKERLAGKLREVARLGPFPTQPLVLSGALTKERKQMLRASLTRAVGGGLSQILSRRFGQCRFVPTKMVHYTEFESKLQACGLSV